MAASEDILTKILCGTTEDILDKCGGKVFAAYLEDSEGKEKLIDCIEGTVAELTAVLDKLEKNEVNTAKDPGNIEVINSRYASVTSATFPVTEFVCMFTSGGYCEITKTTCCNGTPQAKQRCPFWSRQNF